MSFLRFVAKIQIKIYSFIKIKVEIIYFSLENLFVLQFIEKLLLKKV